MSKLCWNFGTEISVACQSEDIKIRYTTALLKVASCNPMFEKNFPLLQVFTCAQINNITTE